MKHLVLFVYLLVAASFYGAAQDTLKVYLDKNFKTTDSTNASYIRTATVKNERYCITDKTIEGKLVNYSEYKSINPWIEDGLSRHYLIPDVLYSTGNYENGKIAGQWIYHLTNSKPDTVNYDIVKTIDYSCCDTIIKSYKSNDRASVEVLRIIDSLSAFYSRNFHLPARTRCNNTGYGATIYFTLDTDGKVKCPHVKGTEDEDYISEILRVLFTYKFDITPSSPLSIDFILNYNDIGYLNKEGKEEMLNLSADVKSKNKAADNDNYDEVFLVVDEPPTIDGDINNFYKHIRRTLTYPQEAAKNKITGVVYVHFIVEKDGSIEEVSVLKYAHPLLMQEAIRVVKSSPKWIPGKIKGVPVRVSFTMPIAFDSK